MPLKCHIYILVNVQISGNYISINASYELTQINNVTRNTGIHTFCIIGICPWKDMPTKWYIYVPLHCISGLQIDPTLQLSKTSKPVSFELSSNMHMYYVFGTHIYFFSSMTTYVFFVWQTDFCSLFMPRTFKIVHTCVSIQNTNVHEVLNDRLKYFTFVSHICSFTSMVCEVFLVWQSYLFLQIPMKLLLWFMKLLLWFINVSHLPAILHYCNIMYLHHHNIITLS